MNTNGLNHDGDVNIGLAGAGYWGSKLARNVGDARGSRLAAVSDPDPDRLNATLERNPLTDGYPDLDSMISDDRVEAVVIATPAVLHAEGALKALEAGKHVLVEKPLALTSEDCAELNRVAAANGLTLMVGQTFAYSEPVRMLRSMIVHGELGEVLYAYSQRLNLGMFRDDLSALWDIGPHDISILLYLLAEHPQRVSARQFSVVQSKQREIAFATLEFPGGVVAHVHLSWLDPRKVRQFVVVGDSKMAYYDDTDLETPIRIYDKGVVPKRDEAAGPPSFDVFEPWQPQSYGEFKYGVRTGDLVAPRVDQREPLRTEIEHFAHCARTGARPLTDGLHGAQVVAVLEAAQRSSDQDGAPVEVEPVELAQSITEPG